MGVNVIWIEDFDEIPKILNSIRNASITDNFNANAAAGLSE